MESERDEVYERIPWETLEKRGGDRQWMVYAVAGAVTLGALAYSLIRSQPAPAPELAPVTTTVPVTTIASNVDSPPSTVASPVVVAQADLYAVDPERLIDEAAAHAEWFALEYMAVDGSDESRQVLRALLPEGIPLPEAPVDTQVFVDWVGAARVEQTGSTSFEVEVVVRSLSSKDGEGFTRQAPDTVVVPVSIDEDGRPVVTGAPVVSATRPAQPAPVALQQVPDDVAQTVTSGELVGGVRQEDGAWQFVVMVEDGAGVKRPTSMGP